MIAFLIAGLLFAYIGINELKEKTFMLAYEVGNRLVMVTSAVYALGEGSCFYMEMPPNINGYDYNITLSHTPTGNYGVVEVADGILGTTPTTSYGFYFVDAPFGVVDVNGNSLPAIPGGAKIALEYKNGVIYIVVGGICQ